MLGSQVESEVGDDEAVTTHVEARMAVMKSQNNMKKPLDFLVAGKSDPAARGLAKESD